MLDDADIQQIRNLIDTAFVNWDTTRRQRFKIESAAQEAAQPMVTKLYLISMGGGHVAFPDEMGRAIFTQAIYARVTRRDGDESYFHSGKVEVVAYSDGQRLKNPITMILTGLSIVAMAEVSEEILKGSN